MGERHVGIFSGHFHLLLGLKAYHSLMQGNVIEYRSEAVLAVGCGLCQFHCFGYGGAERALIVRMSGEDVFSGAGRHGRRWCHLGAECLHDASAVGLLLIRYFHLIYSRIDAEHAGGVCERRAPLAGAGLGGDIGDAFLFAVIGLRNCRIEFVRTHRRHALVLEIDVRGSAKSFFEGICTHQWGGAVVFVEFADLCGNFYPGIGLIQFLVATFFSENRIKVFCF